MNVSEATKNRILFFLQFSLKVKADIIRYCLMNALSFYYLAHVIEQQNLRIPNPQYLQLNFCFNDSENTF